MRGTLTMAPDGLTAPEGAASPACRTDFPTSRLAEHQELTPSDRMPPGHAGVRTSLHTSQVRAKGRRHRARNALTLLHRRRSCTVVEGRPSLPGRTPVIDGGSALIRARGSRAVSSTVYYLHPAERHGPHVPDPAGRIRSGSSPWRPSGSRLGGLQDAAPVRPQHSEHPVAMTSVVPPGRER